MTSDRTDWHIIPVNDLREYEANGSCWCKPDAFVQRLACTTQWMAANLMSFDEWKVRQCKSK